MTGACPGEFDNLNDLVERNEYEDSSSEALLNFLTKKILANDEDDVPELYYLYQELQFAIFNNLVARKTDETDNLAVEIITRGEFDLSFQSEFYDITPLKNVCQSDRPNLVQALISKGAGVNLEFPLEAAIHANSLQIVQILCQHRTGEEEHCIRPDKHNQEGFTALDLAI